MELFPDELSPEAQELFGAVLRGHYYPPVDKDDLYKVFCALVKIGRIADSSEISNNLPGLSGRRLLGTRETHPARLESALNTFTDLKLIHSTNGGAGKNTKYFFNEYYPNEKP